MFSLTKVGDQFNKEIKHFTLTNREDLDKLPTNVSPGSTAFLIDTSESFMMNHSKLWIKVKEVENF